MEDNDDYSGYNHTLPEVSRIKDASDVVFLLGTDRHLDEGTSNQERRVGIIPDQIRALKQWSLGAGMNLVIYVVENAGVDAGFANEDYIEAGATIISESEISSVGAVSVVHSLKEPFDYESRIPGPFIRIGALHTGVLETGCGTYNLLVNKKIAGIFDGSYIGKCSPELTGNFEVPVRSSMSVFAGEIAADQVLARVISGDKIIISGGGVAGVSALKRMLANSQFGRELSILLYEKFSDKCDKLSQEFGHYPNIQIRQSGVVPSADLEGVAGLILTAFDPKGLAPEVVDLSSLVRMKTDGIIIDISIDEGGGIKGFQSLPLDKAVPIIKSIVVQLGNDLIYKGDAHMPRIYPSEASEIHGKAMLPYIGILLYLCAMKGSSTKAVEYIINGSESENGELFNAFVSDLRNGLAFSGPEPIRIHEEVVKDAGHTKRVLGVADLVVVS